jgi:ubiquitin carboxyl-terminal hydrolase 14
MPANFLSSLRTVAPQFAEQSRHGGYAQQDADECFTTMTQALQALPGVGGGEGASGSSFVGQYMMGEMHKE